MDNTKLIAEARTGTGGYSESELRFIAKQLADRLEAAEAALKFKQGLIDDISRDCERAESAAPERTLTNADLDRFETTAGPIYRSTFEAAKASKFLVSTLAQWVMRLTAEVRRLGGAPVSLEAVKAETTTEWNAVRQDATGELWDVYEPFDSREDAERVAAEWRSNNEPGDDPVVVVERTKGVAPGEWQIVTSEVNRV